MLGMKRSIAAVDLCAIALIGVAKAQDLASFEKRTTVKVLPNGLTLIVCERPEAPVFSFYTLVDAGSANDPQGASGIAHMFEHMAFKGSTEIGTTNYPAEKIALAKVEVAYAAYDAEYRKRVGQSPAKLAELQKVFQQAQAEAQKFVIPNQFSAIAEENGAVGINASTAEDSTQYFWSMPSNRLELWAYLESQRIGHPVEREFYKERNVVQEERRMRVDSAPIGRMVEQFLATAYVSHPYRRPGVGWESEISQVSATEATAFHAKYYVPSNIVIAVVGDVKAAEAMPVLERYFAPIPAGPKPEPMTTVEPPQVAEKFVTIREATQPGLPSPRLSRPRRLRLRRHHRHLLQRPYRAPLSQPRARPGDRRGGAGIQRLPWRQVPRPLRRLRRPPPRPLAGRDALGHPQGAGSPEERRHLR